MPKDNLIQRLQRGGAAGFINPGVDTTSIYANALGELFGYMSQKESQDFERESRRNDQLFRERESQKNRDMQQQTFDAIAKERDLQILKEIDGKHYLNYIASHKDEFPDIDLDPILNNVNQAEQSISKYKEMMKTDKTNYGGMIDALNNTIMMYGSSPELFSSQIDNYTKLKDNVVSEASYAMVVDMLVSTLDDPDGKFNSIVEQAKNGGQSSYIIPFLTSLITDKFTRERQLSADGRKKANQMIRDRNTALFDFHKSLFDKYSDPNNPQFDEDGNPITFSYILKTKEAKEMRKLIYDMYPESTPEVTPPPEPIPEPKEENTTGIGDDTQEIFHIKGLGWIDKNGEPATIEQIKEAKLLSKEAEATKKAEAAKKTKYEKGVVLVKGKNEYVVVGKDLRKGQPSIRVKNKESGREYPILESTLDKDYTIK